MLSCGGGLTVRNYLDVHLIALATSNRCVRVDDGQAADRFAAEFPGTIRVTDFAGPCEAKSYISSLDYLVAGRMHACIAAFSSGTLVMTVAYSRKFSGLFGTLGYDFILPVRGMDTQVAHDLPMECLGKREMMRTVSMERWEEQKSELE